MGLRELQDHVDVINQQMARYGVKFGIYKNGSYNERLFPFDPIPRIIEADEFQTLERGLAQRVNALNKFLADIYADKNIIHEGVVPEEFVYRSPGYLAQCEGIRPRASTATSRASTSSRAKMASGTFSKTTCASRRAPRIR